MFLLCQPFHGRFPSFHNWYLFIFPFPFSFQTPSLPAVTSFSFSFQINCSHFILNWFAISYHWCISADISPPHQDWYYTLPSLSSSHCDLTLFPEKRLILVSHSGDGQPGLHNYHSTDGMPQLQHSNTFLTFYFLCYWIIFTPLFNTASLSVYRFYKQGCTYPV